MSHKFDIYNCGANIVANIVNKKFKVYTALFRGEIPIGDKTLKNGGEIFVSPPISNLY